MKACHVVSIVVAALAFAGPPVRAQTELPSPFDGRWDVTLSCPPHHEDDDAKGYVHRFPGEVKAGFLRATHGTEGQPSWHLLTGFIKPDGDAALTLDGIVSNADYAINGAQRGKPYSYRVKARFEPDSGTGRRVGKRKCDFLFKRA